MPHTVAIQLCRAMTSLRLTKKAADAIREVSVKNRLAPTITWEQFDSGDGQWIVGFHSIDNMSDQFLACDVVEVGGLSLVVDGPLAKRGLLASSELDFIEGQFVMRTDSE